MNRFIFAVENSFGVLLARNNNSNNTATEHVVHSKKLQKYLLLFGYTRVAYSGQA